MALWGEPGAMIDGMYTLTTDDLTCNNKHNSYIVHSQCMSNSTASQWYLRNLYWYVMKAGI